MAHPAAGSWNRPKPERADNSARFRRCRRPSCASSTTHYLASVLSFRRFLLYKGDRHRWKLASLLSVSCKTPARASRQPQHASKCYSDNFPTARVSKTHRCIPRFWAAASPSFFFGPRKGTKRGSGRSKALQDGAPQYSSVARSATRAHGDHYT